MTKAAAAGQAEARIVFRKAAVQSVFAAEAGAEKQFWYLWQLVASPRNASVVDGAAARHLGVLLSDVFASNVRESEDAFKLTGA